MTGCTVPLASRYPLRPGIIVHSTHLHGQYPGMKEWSLDLMEQRPVATACGRGAEITLGNDPRNETIHGLAGCICLNDRVRAAVSHFHGNRGALVAGQGCTTTDQKTQAPSHCRSHLTVSASFSYVPILILIFLTPLLPCLLAFTVPRALFFQTSAQA